MNAKHLMKVAAAWMSIAWTVCYLGVALFPGIRSWFMYYALHTNMTLGQNVATTGTFVSGLVIWDAIAAAAVWLFAKLYNRIRA